MFPTRRALELAACLLLATSCAAADGGVAGAPVDDRGVRDAQRYLTAYGYLPNDELAASFPSRRPLVSARPTPGVLDAASVEALRLLQRDTGLAVTGDLDDATLGVMSERRCGVPEGTAPEDPSEKYTWGNGKSHFDHDTISWRIVNSPVVSLAQARATAAAAFARWAAQTSLTFVEAAPSGTSDIQIKFAKIDDDVTLATASIFNVITIDTDSPWSVSTPIPPSAFDMQQVMTHEIGHILGLGHSPIKSAIMYPTTAIGPVARTLATDDIVGISSIYDTWQVMPGLATDVGVGDNGAVWIVGAGAADGGFGIYKWNGSDWDVAGGGAVRIAVDHAGRPWIVNDAGKIYRRTTDSPTSGSWMAMPGSATDIGIGGDSSVWVLGTNLIAGGYGVYKWNGASWDVSPGGAGLRIAVGPDGAPWIVNNEGRIFRRTSGDPTTGGWQALPGSAVDIGIDAGNYAWVVGTNSVNGGAGIYTWDEQAGLADPGLSTDAFRGWRNLPGGALDVAVGPNGRPFIVNAAGNIYRTAR